MDVSEVGYATMTNIVRSLADDLCDSRIVFVLEGGYSAQSLIEGTRAVVGAMASQTIGNTGEDGDMGPGTSLRGIVDRVAAVHAGRYPELGAS
jgi:acetoin utilization deacetylase AcuC-like enzyme